MAVRICPQTQNARNASTQFRTSRPNHAEGVYGIKAKPCMESARSDVWNHHEVMHGINPKEDTRQSVMPYAYGDYIHDYVVITYQSFGLDRKKHLQVQVLFSGWDGRI